MSDMTNAPPKSELAEHRRSYFAFERLVLFATIHIALTLSMVALAFIGHTPALALLGWLGGTVVLLTAFGMTGSSR
jgi:hypothetical protein